MYKFTAKKACTNYEMHARLKSLADLETPKIRCKHAYDTIFLGKIAIENRMTQRRRATAWAATRAGGMVDMPTIAV